MVQKFFCLELLTAGLVIGWFGIMESISSIISSVIMLENVDIYFDPKKFPDTDPQVFRQVVINIFGTNVALNVIDFLASGMLVSGTVKKNRLLLLPWLINSGLSLLFLLIVTILLFVLAFTAINKDNSGGIIAAVTACVIVAAFNSYVWIAIYSLYKHFRRNEPRNEHSQLIDGISGTQPIYTRL